MLFSITNRAERSVGFESTERESSLLSMLQEAVAGLKPHHARHPHVHHGHRLHSSTIAPVTASVHSSTSIPTPPPQPTDDIEVEEVIGRVDVDHCQRCENLIGEEVCGANGKTYVSLCHAVNCAGLRESDITAGRCIEEVGN